MAFTELSPGQAIYYELIDGASARPHLVFLHEGLGCTAMWKAFPRLLCTTTGHPGLVYDRIGYGQSAPFGGPRTVHYMHESGLNELPAVLAAIIPGREHIVIGHSDGGSIALIYAAERPGRLCGVITEAAHVMVEDETLKGIETAAHAYEAGKMQGLTRYHGDRTAAVFRAWSDTCSARGFAAGISSMHCPPSRAPCWPSRAPRTSMGPRCRPGRSPRRCGRAVPSSSSAAVIHHITIKPRPCSR